MVAAANLSAESDRPLSLAGVHFRAEASPTEPGRIDLYNNGFVYYHLDPTIYRPQPTADDFNGGTANLWWFEAYGPDVIELTSAASDKYFSYPGQPDSAAAIARETQRRANVDRSTAQAGTAFSIVSAALFIVGMIVLAFAYGSLAPTLLVGAGALSAVPLAAMEAIHTVTARQTPAVAVAPDIVLQLTNILWAVAALAALVALFAGRGPRRVVHANSASPVLRWVLVGGLVVLLLSVVLVVVSNAMLALEKAIYSLN
jgi:hypothetical protein